MHVLHYVCVWKNELNYICICMSVLKHYWSNNRVHWTSFLLWFGSRFRHSILFLSFFLSILVSWQKVDEGKPKASFSKAETLRFWRGPYSFPWIAAMALDLYIIMLNVKQVGIKYLLLSHWYDSTWDWTLVSRINGKRSTTVSSWCNG